MNAAYIQLIEAVVKVVAAVISVVVSAVVVPWLNGTVVPYLKEKRMYSTVSRFVAAAEKLYEGGALAGADKKSYVVRLLESKGIVVTDEVLALIECAVEELDLVTKEAAGMVVDEFDDYDEVINEEAQG